MGKDSKGKAILHSELVVDMVLDLKIIITKDLLCPQLGLENFLHLQE